MITNLNFWQAVVKRWWSNLWLYTNVQFKTIGIAFVLLWLGLSGLGYPWAWLIAIGISLLDALPVLGSGVVFIPWVLFEWITGDSSQGWWLLGLYLVLEITQQLLEPILLGKDLELPFWLPLVITIASTIIFNVLGIVIAALIIPLIAAYRQEAKRYKQRF